MIYVNGRFLTQPLTGSQRFAYEMLKSLIKYYNNEVVVLVPPAPVIESYNVNFKLTVVGERTNALWEHIDLYRYLKKKGSPLLINLVNSAPLLYKNQIVSIMDVTTFVNPAWFSRAFASYYKFMVPIIARASHKILTISECSKQDIVKYLKVAPEKVEILLCSVSDEYNNPVIDEAENLAVLHKFNLQRNNYLLAVSSLDPRKNFTALVKAHKQHNIATTLVIVGSQGKVFANQELKDLLSTQKNVILTGYITNEELKHLYSSATCFVYPSLYEGFGMPPLEAMACGCPTIVSNTSSLPEVCGNASIYVSPNDIEGIGKAIQSVIDNPQLRSQLIDAGRKQVLNFSWEKSGSKFRDIVKHLVQ